MTKTTGNLKRTILALVGPTGVGKTEVSLYIAEKVNGTVISMDSMQIYRGLDIGTAKPAVSEMRGIPHELIDVADPQETITVADYRKMAISAIEQTFAAGRLPMLVGGTGLYLDAMYMERHFGEQPEDPEYREALKKQAENPEGRRALHLQLQKVDPDSAAKIHENDVNRVVRALEIFHVTGHCKSELSGKIQEEGPYHILSYGLARPREELYARINARVDDMMSRGWRDEVKRLMERGIPFNGEAGVNQAIGYKLLAANLRGEISLEQAVELIKRDTRRYAKRQLTWFSHHQQVNWFNFSDYTSTQELSDALLNSIQRNMRNEKEK